MSNKIFKYTTDLVNCSLVIYQAREFYVSEEMSTIAFAHIPQPSYVKVTGISVTFQLNSEKQKQT